MQIPRSPGLPPCTPGGSTICAVRMRRSGGTAPLLRVACAHEPNALCRFGSKVHLFSERQAGRAGQAEVGRHAYQPAVNDDQSLPSKTENILADSRDHVSSPPVVALGINLAYAVAGVAKRHLGQIQRKGCQCRRGARERANFCDADFAGVSHGWEKFYWTPWRAYLEGGGPS